MDSHRRTRRFPDRCTAISTPSTNGAWTPKVGLEMKLADGALTYVSATRGFKSGGFNPLVDCAGPRLRT